jgi:hypothetical protein
MSLSLRASKDRAKALNNESLYIDPAPHLVCCTAGTRLSTSTSSKRCRYLGRALRINLTPKAIAHATDSKGQCNTRARRSFVRINNRLKSYDVLLYRNIPGHY